jgi:hypothetical protein
MAQMLPGRPGAASGLALGLPIALGGLFVFSGFGPLITSPPITATLIAGMAAAIGWALQRSSIERAGRIERPVASSIAGD